MCVCVLCCCYCLLQSVSVKHKIGKNNLVWKTCLSQFVPLADCCPGFGRCPCSQFDEVLNRNKREATVHAVYLELHIKVVHSLYSTWLSKPNTSWYAGVKISLIKIKLGDGLKSRRSLKARQLKVTTKKVTLLDAVEYEPTYFKKYWNQKNPKCLCFGM